MLSIFFFFFKDTATTEIYTTRHTLSLHDALPISDRAVVERHPAQRVGRRRRRGQRSEEHTSELQSRLVIAYAVFCLKKKQKKKKNSNSIFLIRVKINNNIKLNE